MCRTTKHTVMLPCLGYNLLMQESAPNCLQSFHKCYYRAAKNLWWPGCAVCLQALFTKPTQSNWFDISTKLTKKVALQRWGSHRPAPSLWHETGGVAWFRFLLRGVCPAVAAFTLYVFPFWWCTSLPLPVTREQLSPFPHPPQASTARPPRHYTVLRQSGPHWVHSKKLLCKFPPCNFMICPSECQVLKVPAVQTALRLSSQGTQEMGERRSNSLCFRRQESSVICPCGHTELENQPSNPELEKDHSGSCAALLPFH